MILLAVLANITTVFVAWAITQKYYATKLKALRTELSPKPGTPSSEIVDELLQKAIEYVDTYPDKWSPWGVYKSNADFTAFEFSDEKKGLKITPEGQIKYRNIHGHMKDDHNDSRYIQSYIPLTESQQEVVKGLFVKLQTEHLLRMLDRFGIEEEAKKLETKPKTVV